jgi:hypothetical protein
MYFMHCVQPPLLMGTEPILPFDSHWLVVSSPLFIFQVVIKTYVLRHRNLRRQVTAQNTLEYDNADKGERVRDKPPGGFDATVRNARVKGGPAPVLTTPWCTLRCEYLREFSREKNETTLIGYSVAWGKLINEKNLKWEISWHFPFKTNEWVPGKCFVVHPMEKNGWRYKAKNPGKIKYP